LEEAYLLALDQGTTSSRAIIFDRNLDVVTTAKQEFAQRYPQPGWGEHDPGDIWQSQYATLKQVLKDADFATDSVASIAFANQCETMLFNIRTLRWDDDLLNLFDIPPSMLPTVAPYSGKAACCRLPEFNGRTIPVLGVSGDQQAANAVPSRHARVPRLASGLLGNDRSRSSIPGGSRSRLAHAGGAGGTPHRELVRPGHVRGAASNLAGRLAQGRLARVALGERRG